MTDHTLAPDTPPPAPGRLDRILGAFETHPVLSRAVAFLLPARQ